MALPGFLSSAFRVGGNVALKGGVYAFMGYSSISAFRRQVQGGANPSAAAVSELFNFAQMTLLGGPAQIALWVGIGGAARVGQHMVEDIQRHNTDVRLARTPFSHRFEHTDMTARAQMMGLQQIGQAWGFAQMGGEAAQMARRYGR